MRRPTAETAATVLLLVALVGVPGLLLALNRSDPDATSPPQRLAPTDKLFGSSVAPAPLESPPASGLPPEMPSATASACPSLSKKIPLRVLTLNTHGGRGPSGFSIERIAQLIRSADVDVALLQEVDRDRPRSRFVDMPGALASATGMQAAYGLNVHLGPRRGVSGVVTLSRFPILQQVNTRLPFQAGTKQRGLLRTDLDVAGTTVSVFNTHLEPGAQPIRLRQISAALGPLAETRHPVILGGDLNAAPGSSTLGIARSALRDAWLDSGVGPSLTAPASNPRIRIDYLLYGSPLVPTSTEVLPSVVSDHRGVRSRFVLAVAGDKVCVPVLDGAVGSDGG